MVVYLLIHVYAVPEAVIGLIVIHMPKIKVFLCYILTCCGGTLNALIFMSTFLQLSTQGKINAIPVSTNLVD